MKKRLIIIGIITLILVIVFVYLYSKDNFRFKFNYEYVNLVELSNGRKIKVNIPLENRVKYIKNNDKLIDFLKNGTGIIYFGYNTCPWCRNAIPILVDSIIENDIDTLYYVDIHEFSFNKNDDRLFKILDEYLKELDSGEKVIAVPDVYSLKNGKIVGHHRGCVESYNNPYKGMNDDQKKELKNIYTDMIKEIK